MRLRFLCLPLLLFLFAAAAAGEDLRLRCRWTSPNGRAPLDMVFTENPLLVTLPGENLEVTAQPDDAVLTVVKDGKPFRQDRTLAFTAPDGAGTFFIPLRIAAGDREREVELCVVVPHQATAGKTAEGMNVRADGQEIGHYRHPARSGNPKVRANPERYQPPLWWLRITEANRSFEVVPGLAAGELVVASESTGVPHTDLVPVCYPMWRTIDTLRQALEAKGIPGRALKLISMFRAPAYNRGVGSSAFGRHIFGDAFDFYIDLEGNGKASDLNHDGRLDRRDAFVVVALIEDLQADGKIPLGGIGVYNSVAGDHVVTMHLDMRGHRATWGYLTPANGKRSEFCWASRRFADVDRRDEEAAAERAAKEGRKYAKPRREPLP